MPVNIIANCNNAEGCKYWGGPIFLHNINAFLHGVAGPLLYNWSWFTINILQWSSAEKWLWLKRKIFSLAIVFIITTPHHQNSCFIYCLIYWHFKKRWHHNNTSTNEKYFTHRDLRPGERSSHDFVHFQMFCTFWVWLGSGSRGRSCPRNPAHPATCHNLTIVQSLACI